MGTESQQTTSMFGSITRKNYHPTVVSFEVHWPRSPEPHISRNVEKAGSALGIPFRSEMRR